MKDEHIERYNKQTKNKSDQVMNYFLVGFYIFGLLLAFYYDTWLIAIGVGSLSLIAYYSSKLALPDSNLYQYVLSTIMGVFMAQFIYQMHGMFEMHFFAFIGSAILITYRNWKLQIPLALVVVIHHAAFGYLQFIGFDEIYFTQLEYMTMETFLIHGALATIIFLLCGFWADNFKRSEENHISQSYELGKLQEADVQRQLKQQEITEAVITAQENQLTFLCEELHDNINPLLATVKLYMDGALADEKTRVSLLQDSKGLINTAMEELRTLSRSLVAPSLGKIALTDALNDMVKTINRVNNIGLFTNWEIEGVTLSEKLKLTIYRIVQEQLNNIFKHAGASTVCISLEQNGASLQLVIKDDGVGFDINQKREGVGIQNIISRAGLCSGKVVVNSAPGSGCELSVHFLNINSAYEELPKAS